MKHLVKIIGGALLLIALGLGGYYWWQAKHRGFREKPLPPTVVNTPHENNVLVPPPGFPTDIPLEKGTALIESSLTIIPRGGAEGQTVSYESAQSVATKYALYLSYMKTAGYHVTEGGSETGPHSLVGTKDGARLNVVVSPAASSTLVQIAYLSFGQ